MNPEEYEDEEDVTDSKVIQWDDDPDIKEEIDDGVGAWAIIINK